MTPESRILLGAGVPEGLTKDVAYALSVLKESALIVDRLTRDLRVLRQDVSTAGNRIARLEVEVRTLRARLPVAMTGPTGSAEPEDKPNVRRLHRGENNREMEAYADACGGQFVIEAGRRCNFCCHTNSRFVLRGGKYLCQMCFHKGERYR